MPQMYHVVTLTVLLPILFCLLCTITLTIDFATAATQV